MSTASPGSDQLLIEVLELTDALLAGQATDDQQRRHYELVTSNEEARQFYLNAICDQLNLRAVASEQRHSAPIRSRSIVVTRSQRAARSRWRLAAGRAASGLARAIEPTRHPFNYGMFTMACLLACIFGFFALVAPDWWNEATWWNADFNQNVASTSIQRPLRVVARVTGRSADRQWAPGQRRLGPHAYLEEGQVVRIAAGYLEISFDDGAIVLLEGPAHLEVKTAGAAALQRGKLTAVVSPEAVGFVVKTPAATVTDLGTEFGVAVDDDDRTSVVVMEGEVKVHYGRTLNRASPERRLVEGESLAVVPSGDAGALFTSVDPSLRFTRRLPDASRLPSQFALFQQGAPDPFTGEVYEGCDDVMLISWAARRNYGGRPDFDVGNLRRYQPGRTLIRFDLTSMAGEYTQLRSITLRLTHSHRAYTPVALGAVQVFQVDDANADWSEGTAATGEDPGPAHGESTWDFRRHPDVRWAGFRGASERGVDYAWYPLAMRLYDRTLGAGEVLDFRISRNLDFVQRWIAGGVNAGFLLRNEHEDVANRVNFHSSEAEETGARPQLIVEYAAPVNEYYMPIESALPSTAEAQIGPSEIAE